MLDQHYWMMTIVLASSGQSRSKSIIQGPSLYFFFFFLQCIHYPNPQSLYFDTGAQFREIVKEAIDLGKSHILKYFIPLTTYTEHLFLENELKRDIFSLIIFKKIFISF